MEDDEMMQLEEGIIQLRKKVVRLESKLESKMEQLCIELQTELRNSLESFRIRMVNMFEEMFEKKDELTGEQVND